MLKNILLLIASTCLSLLAAEAVFRMAGLQGDYMALRDDYTYYKKGTTEGPYGFYPNSNIRSFYPTNPRGYFDNQNAIDHLFNSQGYRDVEHAVAKPASTYRILGLGDSYLFGQGVKFEDICLTKLGRILQKNSPHTQIEVINTGISGYNSGNERDLLEHVGLNYKPDMVIVHFVLNDVEDDEKLPPKGGIKIDFFHEYLTIVQQPDTLSRYSHLWGWSRQRYLRNVAGKRYIDYCIRNYRQDNSGFQRCRSELLDIQRICNKNNIKLLVVVFPFFYNLSNQYPFQIIHDQLQKSCAEAGIAILDLLPYFKAYNGPELWVHPVDQHPNEIAHDIAAQAISKYLLENRNVERKFD